MIKNSLIGFLASVIIGLFSCKKSNPPFISCSPDNDIISLPYGPVSIIYNIQSESPLQNIYIYYSVNNNSLVLDSTINSISNSISISYNKDFRGFVNPNDEIIIKIVATNSENHSSTLLKKIIFYNPQNPLMENQFFYSKDNTLFNAYSFNEFNCVTYDNSDSLNCDIREFRNFNDTIFQPELVSKYWYSPNGGLFAKIQSPFYSIGIENLEVLFENSNFGNLTDQLNIGDVYIYKSSDSEYFLILIKDMVEGTSGGKYIFDVRY